MYTQLILSHVRSHGTSIVRVVHMTHSIFISVKFELIYVFLKMLFFLEILNSLGLSYSQNKAMIDLLMVNVTDECELNLNNTKFKKLYTRVLMSA